MHKHSNWWTCEVRRSWRKNVEKKRFKGNDFRHIHRQSVSHNAVVRSQWKYQQGKKRKTFAGSWGVKLLDGSSTERWRRNRKRSKRLMSETCLWLHLKIFYLALCSVVSCSRIDADWLNARRSSAAQMRRRAAATTTATATAVGIF